MNRVNAHHNEEERADETVSRPWLREGLLATILLVVGQGAALLSLLLLSNRMLPAQFGKLSAGLALQNYLVLLGSLGLRTIVVRDLARAPRRLSEIWGTYWSMIAPFGAIIAICGHILTGVIFDRAPDEATMSCWLAIGSWFAMLSVVPLLDALHRQVQALGIVALTEVGFLAGLLTQLIPANLAGLGAAFAIKWALASLLQAGVLFGSARTRRLEYSHQLIETWRPSIPPLLITTLVVNLPLTAAVLLARHRLGGQGAGVVGLGAQLAAAVTLLGGIFVRFIQPMWRDQTALKRSQANGHFNRLAFVGIVGWVIGCAAVGIAVKWLLRPEYGTELIAFLLLVTAGSLGVVARVLWVALLALNDDRGVLLAYACGGSTFMLFIAMLWMYLDVNVIAMATVIGSLSTVLVAFWRVAARVTPENGK